jgi:hypothetical protein
MTMEDPSSASDQTRQSALLHTTPFPNVLLDEAMPRLRDTEWRLLCVIVRQTLGWHDTSANGRKQRDWLTQAQMKRRTGRNSAALSKALDALVRNGLIAVHDERGHPLTTPQQRRGHSGPLFYSLGTATVRSSSQSEVAEVEGGRYTTENTLSAAESEVQNGPSASPNEPSASLSELHKANITKETVTNIFYREKEKSEQLEPEQHGGASQKTNTVPEETGSADQVLDPEVVRFVREYKRAFRERLGNAPLPPVFRRDLERLEGLLVAHSSELLLELLHVFFSSDAAFIKRQCYGLGVFTTSINILQAIRTKAKVSRKAKPRGETYTDAAKLGSWTKASDIAGSNISTREETS